MVLAIYGAGGAGRAILETIRQIQAADPCWESIYFVEDAERHGEDRQIHGVPVLAAEDVMARYSPEECQFTISVGEPAIREKLFNKVKGKGYSLATIVHPSVYVPDSTVLSEGVTVQHGVYFDPDVTVGANTWFHPYVSVGHDTVIGNNTVLAAFSCLAGNVVIGDRTYIAVHVAVREGKKIGSDTIIGMGSMVQRDIPDNVIAMGDPARPMKNKDGSKVF